MAAGRSAAAAAEDLPDPASAIARRAPFADNPTVGERGQRAQVRILDAALQVFAEVGYHECSVKRITELSGCSRAAFYQYFSSKEDLFRHLAARVADELAALGESLQPVTSGSAGWDHLHEWAGAYSEIYDTYEAVFLAFQAAAASDETMVRGATRVAAKTSDRIRANLVSGELSTRELDTIARILLEVLPRANRQSSMLESAYRSPVSRSRLNVAITDVFHRALHGVDPEANVHDSVKGLRPRLRVPAKAVAGADGDPSHGPAGQITRADLLETGHRVFVERGYYATRVADVVQAAGVSHGVFYRYFDNKAHLFQIIASRASGRLAAALAEVPPLGPNTAERAAALRAWLGEYCRTYSEEAAIFTMWSEALSRDPDLVSVAATGIERFRLTLARALAQRGWGDADADGLVLLVVLDAMSSRPLTSERLQSFARFIERGLLSGPDG